MTYVAAAAITISDAELRIVQSAGILAGILVGATSMWIGVRSSRTAGRVARVNTLLTITVNHREIWRQFSSRRELRHALDWNAQPDQMTEDEQQWLRELILHLAASFEAERLGVLPPMEGLDADVRQLMSKPLPHAVWRQLRPYQNSAFASYIETQLLEADKRHKGAAFGLTHSQWRVRSTAPAYGSNHDDHPAPASPADARAPSEPIVDTGHVHAADLQTSFPGGTARLQDLDQPS
jgi:hypothetical protein